VKPPVAYILTSLVVLIPCFWLARVQAGDLGSHIYNAWLAQLVEKGQAPGLAVVGQTTNVLFDLLLGALFRAFGAAAAQRISVSVAVLVFFWGAFAFVSVVSRRAWPVAPVLAMLAYGRAFHMGLFNFYLSLGLCFWAMACTWKPSLRRLSGAGVLLAVAYVAHGLPVAWAAGVLAYAWLWRTLLPRARNYMLGSGLAALVLFRIVVASSMPTLWLRSQLWDMLGVEQLWVYGHKYVFAAVALFGWWIWMPANLWAKRAVVSRPHEELLPIYILTAAGILLIPTGIMIPSYHHQLFFLSQRMSLPLGVVICALLGTAAVRTIHKVAAVGVALLFFGFLYADESVLNDFEDQLNQVVAQLPPGQRVVLSVDIPDLNMNPVIHMIDRACIGRCWSYANYEPSSTQFRVRITRPTTIVAPTDDDANHLQQGNYVVKAGDPPLIQIFPDPAGQLQWRMPSAGERLSLARWDQL
jgi:hypothetical protein